MKKLTKEHILQIGGEHVLECICKFNGQVYHKGFCKLLFTTREGKYAKKYGKLALISILNFNFAEFAEQDIQDDGTIINDAGNDVYELEIFV